MDIIIKEMGVTSSDVYLIDDVNELLDLKIKLSFITINLSTSLEDYKLNFIEKGVSGDYDWFKRASHKKKLYGLMQNLIQVRIGVLNKKEKEKNKKKNEEERHYFFNTLIDVMKNNIGEELFNNIIKEAEKKCSDYYKTLEL